MRSVLTCSVDDDSWRYCTFLSIKIDYLGPRAFMVAAMAPSWQQWRLPKSKECKASRKGTLFSLSSLRIRLKWWFVHYKVFFFLVHGFYPQLISLNSPQWHLIKTQHFFKVPCHIIKYCLTKGFAIFQLYMCIKAQMLNKAGLFQFNDWIKAFERNRGKMVSGQTKPDGWRWGLAFPSISFGWTQISGLKWVF